MNKHRHRILYPFRSPCDFSALDLKCIVFGIQQFLDKLVIPEERIVFEGESDLVTRLDV